MPEKSEVTKTRGKEEIPIPIHCLSVSSGFLKSKGKRHKVRKSKTTTSLAEESPSHAILNNRTQGPKTITPKG
jgi:hypothetical protein